MKRKKIVLHKLWINHLNKNSKYFKVNIYLSLKKKLFNFSKWINMMRRKVLEPSYCLILKLCNSLQKSISIKSNLLCWRFLPTNDLIFSSNQIVEEFFVTLFIHEFSFSFQNFFILKFSSFFLNHSANIYLCRKCILKSF